MRPRPVSGFTANTEVFRPGSGGMDWDVPPPGPWVGWTAPWPWLEGPEPSVGPFQDVQGTDRSVSCPPLCQQDCSQIVAGMDWSHYRAVSKSSLTKFRRLSSRGSWVTPEWLEPVRVPLQGP